MRSPPRPGAARRHAASRRRSAPQRYPASIARPRTAASAAGSGSREGRSSRSMKCPKCGYLGFEHVDRCRNCGYDFSLSTPAADPDISIRRAAAVALALADLPLSPANRDGDSAGPADEPDLDSALGGTLRRRSGKGASSTPGELPLFGPPIVGDEPLITNASPPRAPLAVRRATPEVPRARAELSRPPSLELTLDPEPVAAVPPIETPAAPDRKSTRLNSSHLGI